MDFPNGFDKLKRVVDSPNSMDFGNGIVITSTQPYEIGFKAWIYVY